MPRSRHDDDDPPPRPRKKRVGRRNKSGNSVGWIVLGTMLSVVLVVAVVLAVRLSRSERGDPKDPRDPKNTGDAIADARNRLDDPADGVIPLDTAFPPASWTHQDFANFLRTKGVVVEIQPDPGLRSSHGEGVWFVDTGEPKWKGPRKGRVRVYRCPTQRDALRQVAAMRPEVWIPYAAGNFAIGFDSKDNPTDDDLDFGRRLKDTFFGPR